MACGSFKNMHVIFFFFFQIEVFEKYLYFYIWKCRGSKFMEAAVSIWST